MTVSAAVAQQAKQIHDTVTVWKQRHQKQTKRLQTSLTAVEILSDGHAPDPANTAFLGVFVGLTSAERTCAQRMTRSNT